MALQLKKLKRVRIPTKNSINLIVDEKKGRKWIVGILSVLVILALASLLAKVAVIDLINELSAVTRENQVIQERIDGYNKKIDEYADVQDEYYHYTFTGMNSDELNRTDRVEIIDLLDRYVRSVSDIESWRVSGNVLAITMSDVSLAQANRIVAAIETDELVNFCTITTATTDNGFDDGSIKANITVYLNGPVDLGGNY